MLLLNTFLLLDWGREFRTKSINVFPIYLQSQSLASQLDKKQRAFDKTIDDWKRKVADLGSELENSQRDHRTAAAEVYKLRANLEDASDAQEALRRENKNLSEEIHDLTEQLSDTGRNTYEVEKARKRLEMEKEELQAALEEAEAALEAEEAKVQRANLEMSTIRSEVDRRLAEKDEEFENTRSVVSKLAVLIFFVMAC